MVLCGGYSDVKPADADVQALFSSEEVRAAVAAALGRGAVSALVVEAFRTQVVAGLNYRVLASVDGEPVVITAFKPLPHTGAPLEVKAVASEDL